MSEIRQLTSHLLLVQFGGKDTKNTKKWTTFSHNGVVFAPLYIPHNIPIKYDGVKKTLPPLAEEYATLYAKYIGSEYAKHKSFSKNFFKSWKSSIKGLGIERMDLCNFDDIIKYLDSVKARKLSMTKEEKDLAKEEANVEEEKYKTAMVDGVVQPVGNFKLEPPGIFIGRGCHPKIGTIKPRIEPKHVTINLSKGVPTPSLPNFYKGEKYKKIVNNNKAEWLASWKDNINGKVKYVWLGNKSNLKAKSDQEKYDKARKLGKHINKVRRINNSNLTDSNQQTRQLATALYFIDNLALRVGNEKGDDEADTVGVTSLRWEHITLKGNRKVKLDFLGKDSIRYVNEVQVDNQIYENLTEFLSGKKRHDSLFELINSAELNAYIKTLIPDFTAKVFRTFNASKTFQDEITIINEKYKNYNKSDKLDMLLSSYNTANAKVAMLCNHQKNVSKGYEEAMKKIVDRMKEYKKQITDLLEDDSAKSKKKIKKIKEQVKKYKMKKEAKMELKNISLGTSKTNYIDPRISVAFLKMHDIPVEKVFSQALRDKFFWAFEVDKDFMF